MHSQIAEQTALPSTFLIFILSLLFEVLPHLSIKLRTVLNNFKMSWRWAWHHHVCSDLMISFCKLSGFKCLFHFFKKLFEIVNDPSFSGLLYSFVYSLAFFNYCVRNLFFLLSTSKYSFVFLCIYISISAELFRLSTYKHTVWRPDIVDCTMWSSCDLLNSCNRVIHSM